MCSLIERTFAVRVGCSLVPVTDLAAEFAIDSRFIHDSLYCTTSTKSFHEVTSSAGWRTYVQARSFGRNEFCKIVTSTNEVSLAIVAGSCCHSKMMTVSRLQPVLNRRIYALASFSSVAGSSKPDLPRHAKSLWWEEE